MTIREREKDDETVTETRSESEKEHTRKSFREDLDELQEGVTEMAEAVVEQYERSLEAFENDDEELAREVIESDDEINDLYLSLEQDCIDLMSLQQPVASDLRLVVGSFKIITDLERVGDLSTNIAEYALESRDSVIEGVEIGNIARNALKMLRESVQAYDDADTRIPYEIAAEDEDLDEACGEVGQGLMRSLIEKSGSEAEIDDVLHEARHIVLAIRDIERVGDHSVNIAARVLYIAQNEEELVY
ncbi:MAG: phosphate signaling complex protein PhoU [Halobacteria archaeon]|nr:phosphate signaling complex protein PhoU [Halobacteria archaeon]